MNELTHPQYVNVIAGQESLTKVMLTLPANTPIFNDFEGILASLQAFINQYHA